MYTSSQIADRIKKTCKDKKMQVKDLLEQSGMSRTALGAMRSGSMPKADNLAKIAGALNCSMEYLLGLTDDPVPIKKDAPLADEQGERILQRALEGTGLLNEDGTLSEQGEKIILDFLRSNAEMLKKLLNQQQ